MYVIIRTRYYYGPRTTRDQLDGEYTTRADARRAVAALDATTYYLGDAEYQRPTYRVWRIRGAAS